MSRVLVIGSGMSGTAAALSARASGAEVTVVASGPGATGFVAGPVWPAGHELGGQFDGFEALTSGARLVNVIGELIEARQALPHQARGAVAPGNTIGVVGLKGAPQLVDPDWVVDGLRRVGFDATALWIDLYLSVEQCRRSPFEWATALGEAAEQERWGAALKRTAAGKDLLLLPPVIGFEPEPLAHLQALSGSRLGELVPTTASIPGLRLSRALAARRERAGCAFRWGEVTALERGRATLVTGEGLEFDAAVLATGRFLGGGLRRKAAFGEPLLGLPLAVDEGAAPSADAAIERLAGSHPGEDAPVFRLGVRTESQLHPLDVNGQAIPWLWATGSLLAGPDRGLAHAWASGSVAGRAAAGAAGIPRSAVA